MREAFIVAAAPLVYSGSQDIRGSPRGFQTQVLQLHALEGTFIQRSVRCVGYKCSIVHFQNEKRPEWFKAALCFKMCNAGYKNGEQWWKRFWTPLAFVVYCTVLRFSLNSPSVVYFSAEYMIKNKLQNHCHLFV